MPPDGLGLLVHADARVALRWVLELDGDDGASGGAVLVYLDPPFRHAEMFPDVPPARATASWKAALRDVLLLARRLVSRQGSVWWHVDPPNVPLAHALLCEVMGEAAHVATIPWHREAPWPRDYLLVFSRAPALLRARLDRCAGDAHHLGTVWDARREVETLLPSEPPFPHPKPERLLEWIIRLSTAAGDLVIDPFAGTGTTAAAATKTGRRWIAIESDATTFGRFTRPRSTRCAPGTRVVSLGISVNS